MFIDDTTSLELEREDAFDFTLGVGRPNWARRVQM